MKKLKIDKTIITIFVCMVVLCTIGCVMVYSASSYSAEKNFNNSTYFLTKQIIGSCLGFVCFVFFSLFDYKKLKEFKWILFIVAVILLCLVFVPKIGVSNYGAKRWINLFGLSFQPSEIAKFAFVIFAAASLAMSDGSYISS